MTPKEATSLAKDYVADLFGEEGAVNIGLEELRFDGDRSHWLVTIGFSRKWEGLPTMSRFARADDGGNRLRTFKTVEIDDANGRVLDLRHWPAAA